MIKITAGAAQLMINKHKERIMYRILYNLEQIMKNAIAAGLLIFAVVFVSGTIYGWQYSLMIGLTVLLGITLINFLAVKK